MQSSFRGYLPTGGRGVHKVTRWCPKYSSFLAYRLILATNRRFTYLFVLSLICNPYLTY
jgi:hypothetical protein